MTIPLLGLEGGPCGGKDSSMPFLLNRLRDIGVTAVATQEQATNYFTSGVSIPDLLTAGTINEFQGVLARAIIAEEEGKQAAVALLPGDRKAVLCNRTLNGIAPYMDALAFEIVLHELGISYEESLARYDAVFHLVTAAEGAEQFYNLDNEARTETPEEARALDLKTRNALIGHEHFSIIPNVDTQGNQIDFDAKLLNLYRGVCHALGIPTPVEIERKFLMDTLALQEIGRRDFPTQGVDIRQVYLTEGENGAERRLRARMQQGGNLADRGTTYSYTEKRFISDLVRNESSRLIDLREYVALERDERDKSRAIIKKTRFNFVDGYTYFHLDVFSSVLDLVLMEVEFTDESDELILPDYLERLVISEVTDNSNFKNANIAFKNPLTTT